MSQNEEQEVPLDPAAERLRVKLTRLFIGSNVLMGLGIISVLGVVVYRSMASDPGDISRAAGELQIALPEDARIVEMAPEGGRLFLRTEDGGGMTAILVVDLASGEIVARYEAGGSAPR